MSLSLRPQHREDALPLSRLEAEIFDCDLISAASFRRFARSATAASIVAEADGRIAGYALVLFRARSREARLYSIATGPDFRGQGVGKRLLQACEDAARDRGSDAIRLEVKVDNRDAIAFYEKSGYQRRASIPGYYEDGTDALTLAKSLP